MKIEKIAELADDKKILIDARIQGGEILFRAELNTAGRVARGEGSTLDAALEHALLNALGGLMRERLGLAEPIRRGRGRPPLARIEEITGGDTALIRKMSGG